MKKTRQTFIVSLLAAALSTNSVQAQLPLVFQQENTAVGFPLVETPGREALPVIPTLPDPFMLANGQRTTGYSDWQQHRAEIMQRLYYYEIGEKPQTPRDSIEAWMDADTLRVVVHNNGEKLNLSATIIYPEGDGPFPAMIGIGMPGGSLPKDMYGDRKIAQIAFNFSQVMSHTQTRGNEPINRLYPDQLEMGAYCAWPWGVSRIIDGLEIVGSKSRIDTGHLGITGCSFAGKMALFAGALDERIALTIAQEPGGGGIASWRVSETLGNVEKLGRTNYSWFKESLRRLSGEHVSKIPIDHHEVAALIAPRALLVIGNTDYEWLADESSYVSCQAAHAVWKQFGIADRMGFTFEGNHPHCLLPKTQYAEVQAFIDKYMLGDETANTKVTRADMFKNVSYLSWMPWATISAGTLDGTYFTKPAATDVSSPDAAGFIRRWWLLDPIDKPNRSNTVFTDSYLREAFSYEYFKNQQNYLPKKEGEKVKLDKKYCDDVYTEKLKAAERMSQVRQMQVPEKPEKTNPVLQWHNMESTGYNVHLFRFASTTQKQVYGVLFWAVTVIECDEDINDIRLAVGSNSASMWWLNGEEALILSGDRRMVMDDAMSNRISLKKGKNILRGAVINGPGMSSFCVRFLDKDGKPVENIRISQ